MISLLSRFLIKNRNDTTTEVVRKAYGILYSVVGILLNMILFAGKYFAGIISGSVAITADALNNLSDAGSSIVTLLGFELSAQKADGNHPFGYARVEYLSGLAVSALIIMMALKLAQSSIVKILHPRPVAFSFLIVVILCISIVVKLYMFFYNKRIGKRFNAPAMKATAIDSLSDCVATTGVLVATLFSHFSGVIIDGWCGVFVAMFIFYSGLKAGKENIDSLLGQAPAKEFVRKIQDIVLSHDKIIGIHDLVIHDYGPTCCMISFHVEVPASKDILELHEEIEAVQEELKKVLGCEAVIHLDPVCIDDEEMEKTFHKVAVLVQCIDDQISIYDFRMEKKQANTSLIFNAAVPFQFRLTDEEVKNRIKAAVHTLDKNYHAVINVKKSCI